MFSKENMLRNLIVLIVAMLVGAVAVALAIDSKDTLFKKKDNKNTNIMYANDIEA